MKKIILLLSVVFLSTTALQAQDSNFYLGLGVGYATASGDVEDVESGINLKFIDMGYRFNESWGITAGLMSSGHSVEDYDADELAVGVASFAIGPMYTVPLGNASWDIKPQISLSYKAVEDGDYAIDGDYSGSSFIIGNSFVFGSGKGIAWSIDVDYRMGKIKEWDGNDLSEDLDLNNLMIGAGLRYNF
tara:strand:- start:191 stop:757 length:567 start_codon:yes stop_codon:yes gene_type:complete